MTTVLTRPGNSARTVPGLPAVFRAAVRSEWTKMTSVRSTVWALLSTVVAVVGLGALFVALEVSRWDHRTPTEIAGFDPLLWSFGGVKLADLSIGVLGVLVMTSEYATGAIALTLAATPQRRVLLAAKAATFAAVVAVVSLVSCLAAFLVGQAIFARVDAGLSITDPGAARAVLGAAGHLVLIGIIAVGLGTLLRRTAVAVAVLLGMLLVVPGLVALLPQPWNYDVTKYLPSTAGVAMSAVGHFPDLLGPGPAALLLTGYAAGFLVLASVALTRRDA